MKVLKSNKIVVAMLIFLSFLLILHPTLIFNSSLNAITVWTYKIFPVMFPFFVITRIILNLSNFTPNFTDKFFKKMFNAPNGSSKIFFLSVLAGYPTGAKLICNMFENGYINKNQAQNMMSFCSVSGPMFIIGSVGIAVFSSFKIGIIILISNILAAILNGILYRGKKENDNIFLINERKELNLFDVVYDSIISILIVAAFIVLSFILIDLLNYFNIITFISKSICGVFNSFRAIDVVSATISGIIEMTRGIIDLHATLATLNIKIIIASGLIGFGGFSVILQSLTFLSKINMPVKKMILQKLTQALISSIICALLCIFI